MKLGFVLVGIVVILVSSWLLNFELIDALINFTIIVVDALFYKLAPVWFIACIIFFFWNKKQRNRFNRRN